MTLVGGKPRSFAQSNTRTQCITPQSPLNKVDRWGEKGGESRLQRLDHQPLLWQPHEVLVQTRVLGREERGEEHSSQFSILFKHKTAIGYYDLSIVVSDRAQSNRSDNIGLQDRTFAPKMGVQNRTLKIHHP